MRCTIIDIGSNTIQMGVYELQNNRPFKLHGETAFADIISYIEKSTLSPTGVEVIVETLVGFSRLSNLLKSDRIVCVATASLRYLENKEAVLTQIQSQTALSVEILSGMEEASLAFHGLGFGTRPDTGIGCDLGGGSCQLFTFCEKEFTQYASIPTGTLRLKKHAVRGVLPSPLEMEEMKRTVLKLLDSHPFLSQQKNRAMYLCGGTARAIAAVHMALTGHSEKLDGYQLDKDSIPTMIDCLRNQQLKGIELLEQLVPHYTTSLIPGLIILQSIAQYTGVDQFIISRYGIREGYFLSSAKTQPQPSLFLTAAQPTV